jgi:hypothetical protein
LLLLEDLNLRVDRGRDVAVFCEFGSHGPSSVDRAVLIASILLQLLVMLLGELAACPGCRMHYLVVTHTSLLDSALCWLASKSRLVLPSLLLHLLWGGLETSSARREAVLRGLDVGVRVCGIGHGSPKLRRLTSKGGLTVVRSLPLEIEQTVSHCGA